jgi:solute carrier family 25 carnitine/acylcarnitine transporter 20/29
MSSNTSLTLEVDRDGTMLANLTAISQPDTFASNGVLHRTPSLLLPPHFRLLNSPEKVMLSLNASRFVSLLRQTGLSDNFTSTNHLNGKRTFLVPTDDVLEGTAQWLLSTVGGAKIGDTLKYHILPGLHTPDDLVNGDLLPTELRTKRLGGAQQRLRVRLSEEMRQGGTETRGPPSDITFGDAYVTAEPCQSSLDLSSSLYCSHFFPFVSTMSQSLPTTISST